MSVPHRKPSRFLTFLGYVLLRLLGFTWRLRLEDLAGLRAQTGEKKPVIWMLWHNRLMPIPATWLRWFQHRVGAVLVSRSKDGEYIARIIEIAGAVAVRGSSSRGGASALAELTRAVKEKKLDPYFTPDGPRGPRYSVQPGIVWLASTTGIPVMPVSIEYSRYWRLKSWDGLFIPKPFSTVTVTLHPPVNVANAVTEEEIKAECERLRELMLSVTVTH